MADALEMILRCGRGQDPDVPVPTVDLGTVPDDAWHLVSQTAIPEEPMGNGQSQP